MNNHRVNIASMKSRRRAERYEKTMREKALKSVRRELQRVNSIRNVCDAYVKYTTNKLTQVLNSLMEVM